MKRLLIVAIALNLLAAPVAAKTPLREVALIDGALLDLGIADRIRKECPSITARLFRAFKYVRGLEKKARSLGYSEAEIESYIKSDAEKARLRAKGAAFFAAKGVDTSDPQSYCALGHAEIQKGSRVGSLLKAK